jgi:CTP:molybdopterin cytidylyltransferase MocA
VGDAGLLLAAGEGARLGRPKADVIIDGERLVDRAVRILRSGGCTSVVVVLGAWNGSVPNAEVVLNERWNEGMGSSLAAGLKALQVMPDVDRAIVTLVDLPGVTSDAIRRIRDSQADLVAAMYAGIQGHPVLISKRHWEPLVKALEGQEGAKAYLRDHAATMIEMGDIASHEDLDTPGDLARWSKRLG